MLEQRVHLPSDGLKFAEQEVLSVYPFLITAMDVRACGALLHMCNANLSFGLPASFAVARSASDDAIPPPDGREGRKHSPGGAASQQHRAAG